MEKSAWYPKEKELVAIGISVAAGCKPCTDYHLKAGLETGADKEEIERAICVALDVRHRAGLAMESHAFGLARKEGVPATSECCPATSVRDGLIALGSAFAVSCTTTLTRHLQEALALGATSNQIRSVVKLAQFIKSKAASHAERAVAEQLESPLTETPASETACACS